MRFFDSNFILAALIRRLITLGYYEISEDQIAKFQFAFIIKSSKLDRMFLRIEREGLISFCDNHEYVKYDRFLDLLVIDRKKEEEAFKYFTEKYQKEIDELNIPFFDEMIDSAALYALGYSLA